MDTRREKIKEQNEEEKKSRGKRNMKKGIQTDIDTIIFFIFTSRKGKWSAKEAMEKGKKEGTESTKDRNSTRLHLLRPMKNEKNK